MPTQQPSSSVPRAIGTQQDEETQRYLRWCWAEASVWTDRMLTALDEGVKGGKWFRLNDKVFAERNLRASAGKVMANGGAPGVDHVSVEQFEHDLDANVAKLVAALCGGTYEPQAIRRTYIPKPGSNEQSRRAGTGDSHGA